MSSDSVHVDLCEFPKTNGSGDKWALGVLTATCGCAFFVLGYLFTGASAPQATNLLVQPTAVRYAYPIGHLTTVQ